CTPGTGYW
nr:immunoglobulin heavy chain junction region [Mus musculus]